MLSVGEILGGFAVVSAIGGVFVAWTNNRRDIKNNTEQIALVKAFEERCPISEVKTDVGWLKLIISSDTKSKRKDLWEHHSPLKLTKTAIALIPQDIKNVIDETPGPYETIYKRVYSLPTLQESDLVKLAREKQLNVMELACIIDDYIQQKVNGGANELRN